MDKKSKKFLKEYLGNASPTGHETKGQELWLDYIMPYVDEWHTDVYGTAYAIINPKKNTALQSKAMRMKSPGMSIIFLTKGISM